MDIKRNAEGQVVQKDSNIKKTDTHLTDGEPSALKIGFTIGKEGTVEKLDNASTDFTYHLGGPSPIHPDLK